MFFFYHNTLDSNGWENTSFLINIVKRSLLRLYKLLQVEHGPYRAGIAETSTGSLRVDMLSETAAR